MRFICVLLFCASFLFSAILDKDEAFKFSANAVNSGIELNIDFDKSVYLYADKFTLRAKNSSLNEFLDLPAAKQKDKSLVYENSFKIFVPSAPLKNSNNLSVNFQGCSHSGFCYAPMSTAFELDLKAEKISLLYINKIENSQNSKALSNDEIIADSFSKKSIFWLLASFFGYGILLSLTPCVLPMVPILSAIIVNKANKGAGKKGKFLASLEYVLALSVANAILGAVAGSLGAGVHGILQSPVVIVFSAFIFVILAILMFFYARVTAFLSRFNTSISLKAQSYSGHFGVIFMGFLSALVISPCVALPLAGALLYIAKTGDILLGGAALFVLSIGMSTPLLALGAGFSLTLKPGMWMNKITQIFAFLMFGMALWLLSRIMDEKISFLLFALLAIISSVFLQDFKTNFSKIGKFFTGLNLALFIAGAGFLIVSILEFSGFLQNSTLLKNSSEQISKNSNKEKIINNLSELENFLKSSKRPVIVDFWADWCVNCKEFDKQLQNDIMAQNLLLAFEILKVDLSQMSDEKEQMLKKFELFGPPAFLIFKDGELKQKLVASPNMDEFIKILKTFL